MLVLHPRYVRCSNSIWRCTASAAADHQIVDHQIPVEPGHILSIHADKYAVDIDVQQGAHESIDLQVGVLVLFPKKRHHQPCVHSLVRRYPGAHTSTRAASNKQVHRVLPGHACIVGDWIYMDIWDEYVACPPHTPQMCV